MTDEREFRLHGRDWESVPDDRLDEILDDTGRDNPYGDYTPAEVYALARELRDLRRLATAWHRRGNP